MRIEEQCSAGAVNVIDDDYGAFDAFGGEFILFASVLGITMLLCARREHQPTM